ncbi:YbjN domain-containing protein [Stenomitos frigidus]|uniref:YbjN domain-containing protein n=1 Tax=Stenomitos frigidus ULC18 TaxID=2107698 RepID=A0A2T1E191_9CYAN|nr:YbjN domain-containing protein [Stenomitos frigidus]PSB26499.1 YbjN domain-containing protein [Stenomitos frigidus ULC18]
MTTLPLASTPSDQGLSDSEAADQQADNTTAATIVDVIETVIDSLDSANTAMVSDTDGGYIWKFKYGTVEVFVQLTGLSNDDTISAWSAVLKLPAKDEAKLTRKLLELNWSGTLEARFAILQDEVVVLSTRSIADLSPGEISRAITLVATIADDQDEPLQAEFGAS